MREMLCQAWLWCLSRLIVRQIMLRACYIVLLSFSAIKAVVIVVIVVNEINSNIVWFCFL